MEYHRKALELLEGALPNIDSRDSKLKDEGGVRVFEVGELKEFGIQKLAEAHAAAVVGAIQDSDNDKAGENDV